MLRARGAKLGVTIEDGALAPGSLVVGCDLRGCRLGGKNLTGVSLVGCFLSGASLQDARLDGARLEGCFAPQQWTPVDLRETSLERATVRDCHLHHLGEVSALKEPWPDAVVAAAIDLPSQSSEARHGALERLRELRFVAAAPLVAYLLEDGEWDVRLAALQTLASLRGAVFPHDDEVLLEWMFYALGDEFAAVREHMVEQIAALRPSDGILRAAVDQLTLSDLKDQLAGLRAGRMLLHHDSGYARLIDLPAVQQLARGGAPEVRRECMHFAGYLSGAEGLALIIAGVADEDPTVRAAALRAVALLDERPHALQLAKLLADSDEDVRAEAVYALNQCPDFSAGLLTRVVHDPSAKVRAAVTAVLSDRQGSA